MDESWLDILDDEGESIRSRLMQSTEPIADALLAALSDEEDDDEFRASAGIHVLASNVRVKEIRQLLDKGADPNEACENGLTPLHRAALNGSVDLTKLLVNRGADVNVLDAILTRLTPLGIAEMMGRTDIAEFLKLRCATF